MKLIVLLNYNVDYNLGYYIRYYLVQVPILYYYSFYNHKINYKSYLMCENIGN